MERSDLGLFLSITMAYTVQEITILVVPGNFGNFFHSSVP